MKNCVIYARYSSQNQTERSIEGQLADCKAFADRNSPELTALKTRLRETKKAEGNLIQAIEKGVLNGQITARLNALDDERAGIESAAYPSGKKTFLNFSYNRLTI